MKKKLLFVMLMLLVVIGLTALTVSASETEEVTVTASGTCGTNMTWVLTSDGKLTISGTGVMANYSYSSYVPWYSNCSAIKAVVIEDGVTSIGDRAFYYCTNLTEITIPDGVTSIGSYAFYNCSSLTGITIPDSVTSIGDSAFAECSSLTGITIPDGVTSIGSDAFSCCSSLTGITIPDSVTSIGSDAFSYCSSLTGITIPDSVTSIGNDAFSSCSKLKTIVFEGTTPPAIQSTAFGDSYSFQKVNATAYHPASDAWDGYEQDYGGNLTWKLLYNATLPEGFTGKNYAIPCGAYTVTLTGGTAFDGCAVVGAMGDTVQTAVDNGDGTYTISNVTGDLTVGFGHDWGSWNVLSAATCTTNGLRAHKCSVCNKTVTEVILASHSYTSAVTRPTCTQQGYTTTTCSVCGDVSVSEYVDVTGHNYTAAVTAPTCTQQGYTTYTCSVCKYSYIADYVDATGHSWSEWIELSAATCTAEGSQLRFCDCGAQETAPISVIGHTYDDNSTCTVCGHQAITGSSVTLNSVLGVNFSAPADCTVKITVDGTEYPVAYANGKYTASVFAQDMTKDIVATIYDGEQVLDAQTFSLAAYVAAINESDASAEIKNLATATLNYCQHTAYVKYGTGNPGQLTTIPEGAFADHVFTTSSAAKGISVHTYLEDACWLRLRLSADYADCTATVDGKAVDLVADGTTWLVSTDELLPQDYDKLHTFQISRNGETLYTGQFNVLMYLGRCLDKGVGSGDMQNLLIAMYHYYAAAEAHPA